MNKNTFLKLKLQTYVKVYNSRIHVQIFLYIRTCLYKKLQMKQALKVRALCFNSKQSAYKSYYVTIMKNGKKKEIIQTKLMIL